MTCNQAGRKGGKSRSPKKIAAIMRNLEKANEAKRKKRDI